ncbi:retrovirus-related pol polyprotein from transposon TNT 1-94 [Tanacetum coccineum]|uniref:Retrovirus-related pol polyprotein from transposon TNT 1-94 n=1 Tax=Tanacetum coccineum TaxID=301880 RepID=A0ABQ5CZ58_9ASTR
MAETMEKYMSNTRADYGSGVVKPKIKDKYNFELKGQFFKELRTNTFSGSDHEDANEHIEKVLEIVDLFHIPNITVDQVMLRAFLMSLIKAASQWLRNKPTGSITTWEDMKTKGAIPSKTAADARTAIQEMVEYSQKWHNGTSRVRSTETSNGLVAIQAQLNNLGREIKKERGFRSLPSSTKANPRDQVKSISTTIEADSYPIRRIGSSQYAVSTRHNRTLMYETRQMTIPFPNRLNGYYCEEKKGSYGLQFSKAYSKASHIDKSMPRKEKDPGSFTLPCFINNVCFNNALVDLGASVSVMPLSTYLNLGLGELAHTKLTVELADRTVKYPKGIAENVLVGIGKFTFPVDFIILDMPEDIKVPLILERPFLSTARAKIDVYKRKITLRVGEERIVFTSVKPASSLIKRVYMLSLRERMELDLEARLMGETLVLNRSLDPFLEDYIELNDLNEPFELRRNQGDDLMPTIEEGEVIEEFRTRDDELDIRIDDYPRALMNIPIFVGTFSVMTDFAILENMNAYHDEGMGDVIFGKPFLRVGIKARRFEGMITIYNGNDKVSEKDEMNGISHAYQKFKGLYKGVLNLGPDYIRDEKTEEWLTRGHISVHEME